MLSEGKEMDFRSALMVITALLIPLSPILFWPYRLTREDKAKIRALHRTIPQVIIRATGIPFAFGLIFTGLSVSDSYRWVGYFLFPLAGLLIQKRILQKWWEVTQIKPQRIWPPMWWYAQLGWHAKKD